MNRSERRMMYKKARRRKKILKQAKKEQYMKRREDMFYDAWVIHFGHTGLSPYAGATCHDCLDYLSEVCKGGRVTEECMKEPVINRNGSRELCCIKIKWS